VPGAVAIAAPITATVTAAAMTPIATTIVPITVAAPVPVTPTVALLPTAARRRHIVAIPARRVARPAGRRIGTTLVICGRIRRRGIRVGRGRAVGGRRRRIVPGRVVRRRLRRSGRVVGHGEQQSQRVH